MSDVTTRLGLPTIRAGQAQKELSHNEALALIDLLIDTSVVALGLNAPPSSPVFGQCWIIGAAPTGAWTGHAGQLAGWTEGGWRYVVPVEGMAVWLSQDAIIARYSGATWVVGTVTATRLTVAGEQVVGARQAAVASPIGGTVIDVETRAAMTALLARLRSHGLIAA